MENIGTRIRERRLSLGMSQDELAQRIGYRSRSSIQKIESETYSLRQDKIAEIALALQTTPEYIMGWDSAGAFQLSDEDPQLTRLNELASMLNAKGLQRVIDYMEDLMEIGRYAKDSASFFPCPPVEKSSSAAQASETSTQ